MENLIPTFFIILNMVFPLAGLVAGHVSRFGLSTVMKQGSGQFVQALPFGAGYSLGTYLGFPKNYQSKSSNRLKSSFTINNNMPMGSYRRTRKFSFRRTSWFNRRVYNRKYRRFVYIHRRSYY